MAQFHNNCADDNNLDVDRQNFHIHMWLLITTISRFFIDFARMFLSFRMILMTIKTVFPTPKTLMTMITTISRFIIDFAREPEVMTRAGNGSDNLCAIFFF